MTRCRAKTQSGVRCQLTAQGRSYCHVHRGFSRRKTSQKRRCQATTKNQKRCRNPARGPKYCYVHSRAGKRRHTSPSRALPRVDSTTVEIERSVKEQPPQAPPVVIVRELVQPPEPGVNEQHKATNQVTHWLFGLRRKVIKLRRELETKTEREFAKELNTREAELAHYMDYAKQHGVDIVDIQDQILAVDEEIAELVLATKNSSRWGRIAKFVQRVIGLLESIKVAEGLVQALNRLLPADKVLLLTQ